MFLSGAAVSFVVLLVGSFLPKVHPDPMTFDMQLMCNTNTRTRWCVDITIFELDHNGHDDVWLTHSQCSDTPKIHVYSRPIFPGGDGFLQSGYEVSYQIQHNCTAPGLPPKCHCMVPAYYKKLFVNDQYQIAYNFDLLKEKTVDNSQCIGPNSNQRELCTWPATRFREVM